MSILGINQKLNFDSILKCEKTVGKIHEEFVAENLKTTLSCLTPLGSLLFINNYAQSVLTKYAIIADSLGLLKTEEQVKEFADISNTILLGVSDIYMQNGDIINSIQYIIIQICKLIFNNFDFTSICIPLVITPSKNQYNFVVLLEPYAINSCYKCANTDNTITIFNELFNYNVLEENYFYYVTPVIVKSKYWCSDKKYDKGNIEFESRIDMALEIFKNEEDLLLLLQQRVEILKKKYCISNLSGEKRIIAKLKKIVKNNEENSNRFLSKLQAITEEVDEQTSELSEEEEADELHDERIIEASEELLYLENMYYQFTLDYCKKLKISTHSQLDVSQFLSTRLDDVTNMSYLKMFDKAYTEAFIDQEKEISPWDIVNFRNEIYRQSDSILLKDENFKIASNHEIKEFSTWSDANTSNKENEEASEHEFSLTSVYENKTSNEFSPLILDCCETEELEMISKTKDLVKEFTRIMNKKGCSVRISAEYYKKIFSDINPDLIVKSVKKEKDKVKIIAKHNDLLYRFTISSDHGIIDLVEKKKDGDNDKKEGSKTEIK